MPQRPVLRIAHAYGNRRRRIDKAVEARVDMIEADLRYRAGEVWVRHERRLPFLPILYNTRVSGIHREGPWALSLGPFFLRWDARPIHLAELIDRVSDEAGLLLDLKAEQYPARQACAFVEEVIRALRDRRFCGRLGFCGSWALLDLVRAAAAALTAHYSVDSLAQWDALQPRLQGEKPIPGISIRRQLLDEGRAAVLRDLGVDFYCWNIRNAADAERAIKLGASGVIADDLGLLRALAGASPQGAKL